MKKLFFLFIITLSAANADNLLSITERINKDQIFAIYEAENKSITIHLENTEDEKNLSVIALIQKGFRINVFERVEIILEETGEILIRIFDFNREKKEVFKGLHEKIKKILL